MDSGESSGGNNMRRLLGSKQAPRNAARQNQPVKTIDDTGEPPLLSRPSRIEVEELGLTEADRKPPSRPEPSRPQLDRRPRRRAR